MTFSSSCRWGAGLLLAATLALLPSLPVSADPPVRKVTVVGTATIKVTPDEIDWTLQVSINDATLAKAKARHDTSLAAVLGYLKSLGPALKDLQTDGIRFDKNLYTGDNEEAKRNPYSVTTPVTFVLADFSKYGAICDALVKIDGVQIQSADYNSSKQDAVKRDALKQALLNAHDKANDLAVAADCYIDKPLEIQEGTVDGSPQTMRVIEDQGIGGTPAPVIDQLEITASVTATYDLYYR